MPLSANGTTGSHSIVGVPAPRCNYCRKELDFEFDYSCITCDNHQEIYQEEYDDDYAEKGCALVICFVCFEEHKKVHHPHSEEF